jgi:Uma2 family endonuclease
MGLPAERTNVSIKEYLELEDAAIEKHEFINGEIFAFAGASFNHVKIVSNIISSLGNKLNRKCSILANDIKVKVENSFYYPDILALCNEPQFYEERNDTITNPVLIIEVLSKSTMDFDRGSKFEAYRKIATLQEYVLIDQYRVHVEQYTRNKKEWILREFGLETDVLTFSSLATSVKINDFYKNISFK